MKIKITIEIICSLLVLLFVYAAFSKLIGYQTFQIQISNSPFLKSFAAIIAWLIPGAELIIAVMLTVIHTRKAGLYAAFILLLSFTLYIAGMLLSGVQLPCSCGGIIQQFSWKEHLLFNLFFIVLTVIGIVLERNQKLNMLFENG